MDESWLNGPVSRLFRAGEKRLSMSLAQGRRTAALFAVGLGALAAIHGCGPEDVGVGPCVHTYLDPVIHIPAVTDYATGEEIDSFVISDVVLDGQPIPVDRLTRVFSSGAEAEGDSLVCSTPCGFGTDEGRYELTVSSSGYCPRRVDLEAQYDTFEGGCPSSNGGGVLLEISLASMGSMGRVPFNTLQRSLRVSQPQTVVFRGEQEWEEFWVGSGGNEDAVPRVDFSRFMLIGAFWGLASGCSSQVDAVDEITRGPDAYVVTLGDFELGDCDAIAYPFQIVQVCRLPIDVRFVGNVPTQIRWSL